MHSGVRKTVIVLTLVAAGCGSSSVTVETPIANVAASSTTATTSPSTTAVDMEAFPVTVDAANGPVTIDTRPEHIVSLSPTSTEVLFAIGAGAEVVAVDDQSNYPEEAPVTGLTGFEPNIEAIAGYEADLVILMYDPGEVIAGLERLGIPVIMQPAARTLDDAYSQIEQVGAATGRVDEATALVQSMKDEIVRIAAATDGGGATYFHELSPDYYTATSATFIGSLYEMLGLANIADEADSEGYGYPQLSAEHLLAEDPSFVFLADTRCCGQDADTVAERPGWDALRAVREGAVIELDDDVASRWGPRVVELVTVIAEAVRMRSTG